MNYHLELIYSKEKFEISKEKWVRALGFAKENGWQPAGTYLDYDTELDDFWDEDQGNMYQLWMVLTALNSCHEWNGNYTEKRNQIVSDKDSYELMLSLEINDEFLDLAVFIGGTSFKICR